MTWAENMRVEKKRKSKEEKKTKSKEVKSKYMKISQFFPNVNDRAVS